MTAGTQADEEEKGTTEMELRDGNYLLSVFVSPPGTTLSIEVERKTDGTRWRGDFTASYVTDITQRAGSVKSFSNFVKMLRCATTTNSSSSSKESLYVDVLTYQDLEMLRKDGRAHKPCDEKKSSLSSLSNVAAAHKRYFILTYITEFDRVHYPLPLLQLEGAAVAEETAVIRRCNERLHSELESMKARLRRYESPRHSSPHQRQYVHSSGKSSIDSYSSEDENRSHSGTERCYYDRGSTGPSDTIRMRTPELQTLESARALQEKVKALEDKLRAEAAAHRKSMTGLTRKNTLLEDEARKARVAERRMSEKLRDSEFQINLLRGRLRSLNGSSSSGGSGVRSNSMSPFRTRPPKQMPTSPEISSLHVYQGRLRPSSTPPTRTAMRYSDQGRLWRPSSASPTSGRHVQRHGPSSLPSRSRTPSPMYSLHSTPPPRLKTSAGRSTSCPPTSGSSPLARKAVDIGEWLQAASQRKLCATPRSTTTTMTRTSPQWVLEHRSHELIPRRSSNRNKAVMNEAASEVGEIDSRLYALQDYLKRRNACTKQ